MDAISCSLLPVWMNASDIFRLVLMTTYHLSQNFFEGPGDTASVHLDVLFDADYEAAAVRIVAEFKHFLLRQFEDFFHKFQLHSDLIPVWKARIRILFLNRGVWNVIPDSKVNVHFQVPNPHEAIKMELFLSMHQEASNESSKKEFLRLLKYLNYELRDHYPKTLQHFNGYFIFNGQELSKWGKRPNALVSGTKEINHRISRSLDSENGLSSGVRRDVAKNEPGKIKSGREKLNSEKNTEVLETKNKFTVDTTQKNSHHKRMRRNVQSETEGSNMRLKVRFKLENPGTSNGKKDDFHRHLITQLAKAMRVPLPSIKNMMVNDGIDVSFTLTTFNDENFVMDDQSVFEAADTLNAKIKSHQIRLTDLKGQLLMTAGTAYISLDENTSDFTIVILIVLCVTLLMLAILVITVVYLARRFSTISGSSLNHRNAAYRDMHGRDSSQSIGKYSYDSGLWLGPGPEPNFAVPDAPCYRPPTVEQIASTPRPVTAVRTRLKRNWNVDADRALSTIPDGYRQPYASGQTSPS